MKFVIFLAVCFLVYIVGAAAFAVALIFGVGDPRLASGAAAQSIVHTVTSVGPFIVFLVIVRWVLKVKL